MEINGYLKRIFQFLFFGISALILNACYYTGTATILDKQDTPIVHHYQVEKVYPINGKNWNDYIGNTNSSKDSWSQADQPCTAVATFTDCIHGAERLKVNTYLSSCNNLTLTESLGVFIWTCKVVNGEAIFFSGGIKDGKGLRDLISASGWNNNFVSVYQNSNLVFKTEQTGPESIWWENQIQALPDNSAVATYTLTTDTNGVGVIYYADSSRLARVYKMNSKTSLVTLNGAILRPMDQVAATGSCTTNINLINKCFIEVNPNAIGNWIEADLEQTATSAPEALIQTVSTTGTLLLILNNCTLKGKTNSAADVQNMIGSQFRNLKLSGFLNGIVIGGSISMGNLYKNIISKNVNFQFSIDWYIYTSVFQNISALSGYTAILPSFYSYHSNIIGVSAFMLGSGLVVVTGSSSNALHKENNVLSLLSVNSGGGSYGNAVLSSSSGKYHTFSNIEIINSSYGILLSATTPVISKFTGVLILGNNTANCSVDANTSALINNTCADTLTDGTTSYTGTQSNAILRTNRSAASSFLGIVNTDDSVNTVDTNGLAAFASILIDQFNAFSGIYRGWGKDGASNIISGSKGPCTSGNCHIYDWALSNSDTVIRNISYDGANQNDAFVNGGVCPQAVNGNVTTTDLRTPATTYLTNAWEIIGDGIGNDNGLCESGESCIYTPNIGAYQGHGDYWTNSCLFQNGTVSDVNMYAYPVNGY